MFGTKHSKINWLQKTIEYKTNEQGRLFFASNKLALNYIKQARLSQ